MEAIFETDEAIKKRKKGMGSKHHSLIQLSIITQMVIDYNNVYKAIPELSLDLGGQEKIPDLSIYKTEEMTWGKEEIRTKQLPLGVIEILSPTQILNDLVAKSEVYFDAGISSYWVVIPSLRSIYVFSSKEDIEVFTHKDQLKDKILDIVLDLSKIF